MTSPRHSLRQRPAGSACGRLVAGLGLWLALGAALGQTAGPDEAGERARIERERQAVQARFSQAEQACAQQFQTTDCLNAARAERRQALDRLHRERVVLDDARRRARAAERLQGQERRRREREARALLAEPGAASAPEARASAVAAPPAHRAAPATSATAASAASASHAAQAAAYQRRQAQAAHHAQAVQQRNAAQDARRPPAAPLPLPGKPGASGPAAGR